MKTELKNLLFMGLVGLAASTVACGDDDPITSLSGEDASVDAGSEDASPGADGGSGDASPGADASTDAGEDAGEDAGTAFNTQIPPATAAEMTDWLAEEFHKQWDCSPTVISPVMPHGAVSTVCSNAVIMVASSTTTTPPWPVGSASVKESFTDDTRTSTAGVFAYVKTSSSSWFWYANGSEVDAPNCVGCHAVGNEVLFQAERTQTPPTDAQELEAWITAGSYATDWLCESEASEPRGDSPHAPNRICVNNVVSTSTSTEDSDWNIGAATIKELYTTVSDATPFGHLVSLKANVDSEDGANWFWYAPNGNGFGLDGCIGCHDGTTDTSSVSRDYIRLPLYR